MASNKQDPDLSVFEQNSGRGLPAATVKEMKRLEKDRQKQAERAAKKSAGKR